LLGRVNKWKRRIKKEILKGERAVKEENMWNEGFYIEKLVKHISFTGLCLSKVVSDLYCFEIMMGEPIVI
jgi:hypothetical protein